MTDNPAPFIFKILLVSTLLSAAIKYGGSLLAIAPTFKNAAIAVVLPPIALALGLLWQIWRSRNGIKQP